MKTAFTIFLIIGFIGIAVFGVFAMNHGSGYGHSGCIAVTAQRADCPRGESALSFIAFHLDAFHGFTTAIFGDNSANALILLIALTFAAVVGIILRIRPFSATVEANYYHKQFLESRHFSPQRKFIHWLALRENSPSFV